jgi:hypothetical protein
MANPGIATPDTVGLWTRAEVPALPWTPAPRLLGAVGPVYFLYGGASVWTVVR